jgi:ubiquinone/menaquinone biosynthesis C-methylase UbiE
MDWIWNDKVFDFIHARSIGGGIHDLSQLLQQAYRCLKPGGYIEFAEFDMCLKSDDGTLAKNSAIFQWQNLLNDASIATGRPFNITEMLPSGLSKAGFTDCNDVRYKVRCGSFCL